MFSPKVADKLFREMKAQLPSGLVFTKALGTSLKRADNLRHNPETVGLIIANDVLVKPNDNAEYAPISTVLVLTGNMYPIKDPIKETFPNNFMFRGYMLEGKAVKGWIYVVDQHDANTVDVGEVREAVKCAPPPTRTVPSQQHLSRAAMPRHALAAV